MDKTPFSIYDFLGYLFAGFLLLAAVDYAFDLHWLIGQKMEASSVAFWVVASYVTGHVNAQWASWLYESKLIKKLGYPSANLFAEAARRPFKHYRTPLPAQTAKSIRAKFERMSAGFGEGEDMFLFSYHLVKEQCPQATARLGTFLNVYGFARNLSFASVLVAIVLAVAAVVKSKPMLWPLIAASLVVAVTLFFRFLKYYRHYSIEVFATFLTSVKEDAERKPSRRGVA
ncbi:MAG TPA: hypothetical protein VF546_19085 [Pyrinomonadaceae bacterium]|jgi:hypothetical protein